MLPIFPPWSLNQFLFPPAMSELPLSSHPYYHNALSNFLNFANRIDRCKIYLFVILTCIFHIMNESDHIFSIDLFTQESFVFFSVNSSHFYPFFICWAGGLPLPICRRSLYSKEINLHLQNIWQIFFQVAICLFILFMLYKNMLIFIQ